MQKEPRPAARLAYRGLRQRLSRLTLGCSTSSSSARSPSRRYGHPLQPGINEDMAGRGLGHAAGGAARRGQSTTAFGLWYGRDPASTVPATFSATPFAGTSKHGGVLALMGDDTPRNPRPRRISRIPLHRRDSPILNPAGVQDVPGLRPLRWAMSRFTGAWVALKCMHEPSKIDGRRRRQPRSREDRIPTFFRCPSGLNIRLGDSILGMERGCTTTSATPCSPSCAPTSSTLHHLGARNRRSHHPPLEILSHVRQGLRRAPHRRGQVQTTSASGSTRSRARGRFPSASSRNSPTPRSYHRG